MHDTEIENFKMFISHNENGSPNISYGLLVNEDLMIELTPKDGPVTRIEQPDVLDTYLTDYYSIDRSNWFQQRCDDFGFNRLLNEGKTQEIVDCLKDFI